MSAAIDRFLVAQRQAMPRARMIAVTPAMASHLRARGADWRDLCAKLGIPCHDDVVRLGDSMAEALIYFELELDGARLCYGMLTPDEAEAQRAYLESLLPRVPTLSPRAAMLPLFGEDGNLLLVDAIGQVHSFWFHEEARTSVVAGSLGELLARTRPGALNPAPAPVAMRIAIEASWLVERLPSFDPVEAARFELRREGLTDDAIAKMLARRPAGPAGWDELLAAAAPGDSLWYFRSPRASWRELAGRSGFAMVRDGVPIAAIVTSMS